MNDTIETVTPEASGPASAAADPHAPAQPLSVSGTGLSPTILLNLVLKTMYTLGLELADSLADHLKLHPKVVNGLFEDARNKGLMMLGDSPEFAMHLELHFQLTDKGREHAIEALEQSHYAGPAPVPMTAFLTQIEKQSIAGERIDPHELQSCFDGMVISEKLAVTLGAALSHGHSLLLYGPPGNGKTIYSEAVVRSFKQPVYIPYAVEIDGQVISVFDPAVHEPMPGDDRHDPRWVRCRRPAVIAGGELTMDMLELLFDPFDKVYEAPLQLKATGGVFIIDDFGRQSVPPERILNRWIVPLERKRDYLALHSGKKVAVPFDELLIFSTNLEPESFMDAAMMRRIHYKIEIGPPTRQEFTDIMAAVCRTRGIDMPPDLVDDLFTQYYDTGRLQPARFHPEWIVQHVESACAYEGLPVKLESARVDEAMGHLAVGGTPRGDARREETT